MIGGLRALITCRILVNDGDFSRINVFSKPNAEMVRGCTATYDLYSEVPMVSVEGIEAVAAV